MLKTAKPANSGHGVSLPTLFGRLPGDAPGAIVAKQIEFRTQPQIAVGRLGKGRDDAFRKAVADLPRRVRVLADVQLRIQAAGARAPRQQHSSQRDPRSPRNSHVSSCYSEFASGIPFPASNFRARIVRRAFLLIAFTLVIRAQSTDASLTGRVTDPSKGVIANAKVAAIAFGTNLHYEAATNGSGEYYLLNIPPAPTASRSKSRDSRSWSSRTWSFMSRTPWK
jgi:hypothetical protein